MGNTEGPAHTAAVHIEVGRTEGEEAVAGVVGLAAAMPGADQNRSAAREAALPVARGQRRRNWDIRSLTAELPCRIVGRSN